MKEVGIIAQDLQEVLPEAVVESEGMLTISDSAVNALLINAIKELRAEIAEPKGLNNGSYNSPGWIGQSAVSETGKTG